MKKFRKTHDFGSISPRWSAVTIACARFDTSSFSYSRSTYGDREDDDPGQHARDADHEQLEQGEAGLVSAAGPSRAVAGTPDRSGDEGPNWVVHAAFLYRCSGKRLRRGLPGAAAANDDSARPL